METKLTNVSVRFNSADSQWSVVDARNNPIQNFQQGMMTNVRFSTVSSGDAYGCGGRDYVGIATGDLEINKTAKSPIGWRNIGFSDWEFRNAAGDVVKSAKSLRLMPSRRAMFKA